MDEGKTVRFITSDYKELFHIPDGGKIKIIYPPGDQRGVAVRTCKYLDEYHFRIFNESGEEPSFGQVFHICEFAERMEDIGARYEPEMQIPDAQLIPFTPGEEGFYTYNREKGNACIGHIAGDFGQNGDRFHSSWYNHKTQAEAGWTGSSPEFQLEMHSAVFTLRQNLLKEYNGMLSYCENHPQALIDSGDTYKRYGFKLETDARRYYIQCFFGEYMRDARFIIYAYENPMPALEQKQPTFGVVLPGTDEESRMFFRNDRDDNFSVGYLRGDFGKSGDEFWHNWFDGNAGRKTPEFQAEFQGVIDTLRQDILKDQKSSIAYCYKHPEAKLKHVGDGYYYGFKLETESRNYFIRCSTYHHDYFYVFVYDKAVPTLEQKQPVDALAKSSRERLTARYNEIMTKKAERPSVLKQIHDSQNSPKPPCKDKAPDKKTGREVL